MQDEQQLIYELKNGNRQAMGWLYDKYASVLYGIALKIVGSEMEAQDVVQEAFVKIWKNVDKYEPGKGTFFTWILNITRNTGIDKIRSAGFRKQSMIQGLDSSVYKNGEPKTYFNPDTLDLKQNLGKLDPKYQQIIELAYFHGFTQKEIEEELNIPIGTVKSRIRIALRELRKIFSVDTLISFLPVLISLFQGLG